MGICPQERTLGSWLVLSVSWPPCAEQRCIAMGSLSWCIVCHKPKDSRLTCPLTETLAIQEPKQVFVPRSDLFCHTNEKLTYTGL